MANMALKRNLMPTQDATVRARNFDEVALGYDEKTAIDEANRCLNCKTRPCVSGCPVNVHIPEFIDKIKEGDFEGAYRIISESSSLPAVCGRVCPQETQCEAKCIRGIKGESVGIGRLERFVADWHNTFSGEPPTRPTPNGHRVAVVGSGPSGLTCAVDLARAGYEVTVYEALHRAGGVLVYGIPEFRLPKAIVAREIAMDPDVLIAVQPTRGLDVGAIEYIHRQLVAARDAGKAVLLVSLELDEVMNLSDRILVIGGGRVTGTFLPASRSARMAPMAMLSAIANSAVKSPSPLASSDFMDS